MCGQCPLVIDVEESVLQSRLKVVLQLRLRQPAQKIRAMNHHVPVTHARGAVLQVLFDRGLLGRR